jgi:Uncharacterized protein conserved in bacteria (DUF2188)
VFSDQGEAVRHGRDIAKREKTELFIHGRDGTVREQDSYANDPDPPRSRSGQAIDGFRQERLCESLRVAFPAACGVTDGG